MSNSRTAIEYAEEILKDKKPYALKIAKELRKAEGDRVLLDQAAQCLEDDCDYLKKIAKSINEGMRGDVAKMRQLIKNCILILETEPYELNVIQSHAMVLAMREVLRLPLGTSRGLTTMK